MALNGAQHEAGYSFLFEPTRTLAAAITGTTTSPIRGVAGAKYLSVQGVLTVSGGGTNCKVWVQTSLDFGVTWFDILSLAFLNATLTKVGAAGAYIGATPATPTDGTLADNTANQGLLGSMLRLKITTTGTFTGATTLQVTGLAKG